MVFSAPPFGGKIKEPFFLENASNLTHEFFMTSFDAFSRRNDSFIFSQKEGAQKQKC